MLFKDSNSRDRQALEEKYPEAGHAVDATKDRPMQCEDGRKDSLEKLTAISSLLTKSTNALRLQAICEFPPTSPIRPPAPEDPSRHLHGRSLLLLADLQPPSSSMSLPPGTDELPELDKWALSNYRNYLEGLVKQTQSTTDWLRG